MPYQGEKKRYLITDRLGRLKDNIKQKHISKGR